MEVRKLNHSVYRLQYHVVWVVKYRLKLLNPGLQNHLGKLLRQEAKSMPGVEIQEREHVIRNYIKYQEKLDSGQALLDL